MRKVPVPTIIAQNDFYNYGEIQKSDLLLICENERFIGDALDFERFLYRTLVAVQRDEWREIALDTNCPDLTRARAGYLYTYLGGERLELKLDLDGEVGLWWKDRPYDYDNELIQYYKLKNGVQTNRFELYKRMGTF